MRDVQKILVPTDLAAHPQDAFCVAQDLAKSTGASVVVFHVARAPAIVSDGERHSFAPPRSEAREAWDELRKFQADDPAVHVEHELIVADRPDAKHILRILEEHGCDLIVMGTRRRSRRKRVRFGSVTEDIMRRAHCPVILVVAPAREDEESTNPSDERAAARAK
jgi:nucleotide-binding universal stress UspA family protein